MYSHFYTPSFIEYGGKLLDDQFEPNFRFSSSSNDCATAPLRKNNMSNRKTSLKKILKFFGWGAVFQIVLYSLTHYRPFKTNHAQKVMLQKARIKKYSSHKCIGGLNDARKNAERTCRFDNLCVTNGKFFYYEKRKHPIIFDASRGIQYEFNVEEIPFALYRTHKDKGLVFKPSTVIGEIPAHAIRANGTFALWKAWDIPFNFGHLVWEDIGTLYYTQRRLEGSMDYDTQPIHMGHLPPDKDLVRTLEVILPSISNRPTITFDTVPLDSVVCFDRVFVGGGRPMFSPMNEPFIEGREEVLMGFRSRILQHLKIKEELPGLPIVYITHKSSSVWAKQTAHGRHRAIANAEALCNFLRNLLPSAVVEVIEWHKIGLREQLTRLAGASLLITPCGGVSMVIPFLPEGAHAIVMDYLSDGEHEEFFGYKKGQSASMEVSFLNRFPHVTKYFYQIHDLNDIEWDFEGATDLRNDASIVVNFQRMEELVLSALISMGYNV